MLLLASPFQSSIPQKEDVERFMAPYATDLIAQKRDLEKRRDAIDPFQKLNPIDAKSPHSPPESAPETPSNADNANASSSNGSSSNDSTTISKDTSSEWYVEEIDEGVDHYMFPRMMGYLVLEKQYELYPLASPLSSRSHSALLADREARWKSFLERIGGVESLSFKLTRQSGNRWKIFNVTQEDRNRQELRGLIHEGVEAFSELNV